MRPRLWSWAGAGLSAALTLAACGVPSQGEAERIPADRVPFGLVARAGESPTSSAVGAVGSTVYLIRSDGLVPVERSVSGPTGQELVALLAAGPSEAESANGLRSAINDEDVVGNVVVSAPVAGVDLSDRFGELPRGDQLLAVAQLVYTLTGIPEVKQLTFQLDGRPTAVPRADGSLSDLPVGREDYRELVR